METKKPVIWTSGDWNAFFGFGTNILVNLLTLSGLLRAAFGHQRAPHVHCHVRDHAAD
jgi:hypothetical protein